MKKWFKFNKYRGTVCHKILCTVNVKKNGALAYTFWHGTGITEKKQVLKETNLKRT